MLCKDALAEMSDALKEGPLPELENHLNECSDCRTAFNQATEGAAAFREIPEIVPSAWVLHNIQRRLLLQKTRSRRLITLFRRVAAGLGAAAAVTLAVIVAGRASTPGAYVNVPPRGSSMVTGQTIPVGEPVAFPAYASLLLPDIGTVRVREGTRLAFETPNDLRLEAGEVFVEITPGKGQGFRVRTEQFSATVTGTSFGATPGLAYVLEGTVHVVRGETKIPVGKGELFDAATGRTTRGRILSRLEWIREYETPNLQIWLESPQRLRLDREHVLRIRLATSSRLWPVFLRPYRPESSFLQLQLDSGDKHASVRLEILRMEGEREQERFRVDEAHPVRIEARVTPSMLEKLGRPATYTAILLYTADGEPGPRVWTGNVASRPFEIEVP